MTSISEQQAADVYCRYLAGHHYENFSVASLFLPADIRLHLARLYAYCRTTDDLGDESGSDGMSRLAAWRAAVEQCLTGGPAPIHPVLLALQGTIATCHLPAQPFLDLIAANVQDQTVSTYNTWNELRQYCLLSAAPVGRLVLRIWGVEEAEADRLSDDVCIGLQLANFAQDVAVDRAKGRTYLLQEDLRSLGIEGAIRAMCGRAEQLLDSERALEAMVPGLLRAQLRLYRLGGMAILAAIAELGYRTDQQRPQVSRRTKLGLLAQAIIPSTQRHGRIVTRSAV